MKFLKRIRIFVIYSLVLSILYIPNTGYAAWSGSAYSPGETLNPECAPTDSGCTVNIGYTLSSGNIGIGSTTPWGKLSVNPNGITGPSFVIGSSTGTSFVVDNGGRVGVGTSSPGKKLQVYVTTSGDGIGIDGTTNPAFNLRINGVTKGNVAAETTGNAWFTGAALNDIALIASSGNLALVTGTTARLYVSTAGNVGIGTTSPYGKLAVTNTGTDPSFVVEDSTSPDSTPFIIDASGNVGVGISAPTAKLHVYPNVNSINGLIVRGDNNQSADIQQWQNSSGTTLASILAGGVFYTAADGTGFIADAVGNYRVGFMKYGGFYGSFVHNSVSPFTIYSNSNSDIRTVGTMRTDLIIDASGLVGIGSSTPYAKLSITNTGTNPSFVVEDSTSPDSTPFIIDASGNVGVGTSSPDSKLSITQSANTPAGGLWIAETGNTDFRSIYMSDTSGTLSFFGGDTAGALNTATLSSAGTWTNASDRSYKENIANLDTKYNLNTLLSIQPRFYTMKGSGKPQIGFIAQELQPILPEVVEGTEGSLGISYGNMVALLVQAIKDINVKVDNLATTVSDKVKVMFGEKVETKRLCLEGLCITRDELQRILYTTNVNGIYEQTIPSSTNNQQNNSNNSSNNSTNQNASNNNVGTSTEQTNNSTTTPQSNINPDAGSNNTNNTETNTQTNTQSDNTQGSTTPATIPETPPETTIEQPVPPQTPDISSTTLNTLPEQTN